jgi:4,5-dihydroxyphthalate decarboxylase
LVWARSILQDDYGIRPEDVTWVRGGIDTPGRPEKISLNLPANVTIESAPEDKTISDLLHEGEIDAFIAPRPPSGAALHNPHVAWLFDDPTAVAKDYYRRTGIFPIMHVVGIRQELAQQHRWLPAAVFKAFSASKAMALELLADTSATKVTLPFVEEQLKAAQDTLGHDFWSYGVQANRNTLNALPPCTGAVEQAHGHRRAVSPLDLRVLQHLKKPTQLP